MEGDRDLLCYDGELGSGRGAGELVRLLHHGGQLHYGYIKQENIAKFTIRIFFLLNSTLNIIHTLLQLNIELKEIYVPFLFYKKKLYLGPLRTSIKPKTTGTGYFAKLFNFATTLAKDAFPHMI